MKHGVLLLVIFSFSLAAQVNDRPDEPPPDVDPPERSNLPQTIASGLNYYSFVPLSSEGAVLRVDNQSERQNHILMVGETAAGDRESEILILSEADSLSLPEELSDRFIHIYLISMQPFHVSSDRPIDVLGLKTRHFTTVAPTRPLQFLSVENTFGKTFLAGVMPDGSVHYPVFGYRFGVYEREAGAVMRDNGAIYEVLNLDMRR